MDDFESYTDVEGERIYEIWIDGWTNGTGLIYIDDIRVIRSASP